MHYHGHRERVRSRLDKNPAELPDYEILELLLGKVIVRGDTKPLAKELLARFASIKGVLEARPEELLAVPGFGPALLSYWKLLREVLARYAESPLRQREELSTTESVAKMAMLRLAGNSTEEIWVAFVDGSNRLLAWERTGHGSNDRAIFYPRDVIERGILLKASGFFIVHNHPSGSSAPSGADISLTKQMGQAAATVNLRFLDHIIVTDSEYCSLAKDGLI